MYPENGGPDATLSAAIGAAGIDGSRVMADCHVAAGGGVDCAERTTIWQDFGGSGINCETNAVKSNLLRGALEAADLLLWCVNDHFPTSATRART